MATSSAWLERGNPERNSVSTLGTHLGSSPPPRENPVASRAYAGIIKNEIAWAMALGSGNVTESCLSADGIAFYRGIVKITSCTWITEDAAPAYKGGRVWQFQASEVDGWA